MAKEGGIFTKLVMGTDKTEAEARMSLPSNRWELFWDILKGSFSKLCGLNLLILLFFIPVFVVFYINSSIASFYASESLFSGGLGVGYPGVISLVGVSETIKMQISYNYVLLPIASLIAGLGIAGGAYVMKSMVWSEGVFVSNDFWRGIKKNYSTIMGVALFFSIVFFLLNLSMSYADLMVATETDQTLKVFMIIAKVVAIICLVFITIMTLYMITIGVTYKCGFFQLIKNAFILTWALLPQNLLFAIISAIPFVLLLFGGGMQMIAIIILLCIGVSWALLVWTNYSQWVFDKHVNDNVEGAVKNRGIYEKVKKDSAESLRKYKEGLQMAGRSKLTMRPIRPLDEDDLELFELPTSFSRKDLERLKESKDAIKKDIEDYVEEHKNDERYQLTEEEKQMEAERLKRIEEAQKALNKGKNKKRL